MVLTLMVLMTIIAMSTISVSRSQVVYTGKCFGFIVRSNAKIKFFKTE